MAYRLPSYIWPTASSSSWAAHLWAIVRPCGGIKDPLLYYCYSSTIAAIAPANCFWYASNWNTNFIFVAGVVRSSASGLLWLLLLPLVFPSPFSGSGVFLVTGQSTNCRGKSSSYNGLLATI